MKKVLMSVIVGAGFSLCAFGSRAQGACNFEPQLTQGEHREYRGLYENKAYGYSVTIPPNLVGYDSASPLYQHGFGILLGNPSYLYVNGEPNSLEFTRLSNAAAQLLKYLGKDAKVESSKITRSQLGGLNASLLTATYTCSGSTEKYICASIVAISPDKANLYELVLYARSDRFEQDRPVLDALAKSWKYKNPSNTIPSGSGRQEHFYFPEGHSSSLKSRPTIPHIPLDLIFFHLFAIFPGQNNYFMIY